ncbi:DNA phosphorothioation-dependent restriction protein DptG [uncultured Thomasclavelia sp.]|uniref:DNA phosphorothioation-dependent restriction protein DptG n=1 Tax=uncultured Thomasclavelia sp. TaxID=3025759 RepID=UPI002630FE39|nr:DNA phosphorothioation-dependent restriction protein DptG [uncultured Thomasclavelia sp.]
MYHFSEEEFKKNFKWKSLDEKSSDSCRIYHIPDQRFKLFPYKATGKKQSPIVIDMEEVIGEFIKIAMNVTTSNADFDSVINRVIKEIDIEKDDIPSLLDIIKSLFYKDGQFVANNIGMYVFKGDSDNKSVPRHAIFLNDVLRIDDTDKKVINTAMDLYPYNALERLMIDCIDTNKNYKKQDKTPYFVVYEDAAQKFKKDFHFMLKNGMSSPKELSNLLALYYLYYTSQTCITLDHFGSGSRTSQTKLFFALDWEKVSANRECCRGGWKSLHENVNNIFCHAITLELLNQIEDTEMMVDYIKLSEMIHEGAIDDQQTAKEIENIEQVYIDAIGDYTDFNSIAFYESTSSTDTAIQHLFKCVKRQFLNTDRKRANEAYVEKLTEFYKNRWLKNRKKAGLVFNLTESDIIFLTKISIQNSDRIRLADLFTEYEKRGIYLDNISKGLLQQFFTRLNLLDKKSDSGDAQYVKRIL